MSEDTPGNSPSDNPTGSTGETPEGFDFGPDRPAHRQGGGWKGSTAVLAIVASAVVVVVIAAVVLIANRDSDAGDDSGDAASGTPGDVVEQYFAAAESADCETLISLVSDVTWEQAGMIDDSEALANCNDAAESGQQLEGMSLEEIGEVTEDGDVAVVEVSGTFEGEPLTETFRLVREDGDWKLDLTE